MCAYKLVRVEFKLLGFQDRTEAFIHKVINFFYFINKQTEMNLSLDGKTPFFKLSPSSVLLVR